MYYILVILFFNRFLKEVIINLSTRGAKKVASETREAGREGGELFFNEMLIYSAAQNYANQNIRVIRVSPIRTYAYTYTHIRIYSIRAYA